ncbi:MAG: acetylxylan esterase [Planctomycetes bacterium]|nr:acetylxylan esterase [Planctomycetota bacterium]
MGDLPDRYGSIACRTVSVEERPHYWLERLVLDLNGLEEVPACLVRPLRKAARCPAVLYSHAHGDDYVLGKEELLRGRPELQGPPYAEALASRGYAVLAIDQWNFGERRGRTESELFKEMLWKGRVLFGHMVYDCLRALDYLCSRPDVDPRRIGAAGMSMGSTLSWWTAALDERVAAIADLCCMTDFHALLERRGLDGHGIYYYVPGLLKHFTTARIQALICPRPHLSLAGNLDPLTPPEGLDRIDRQMKQLYGQAGASQAWRLIRYDVGHLETAAMRAEVLAFLHGVLGGAA